MLHTRDLEVVYVGQVGSGKTQSLFDRLKQHTKGEELWNRWRYFSWFGWRAVNIGDSTPYNRLSNYGGGSPKVAASSEDFLDEIEAVVIQIVEPKLNKQGAKWKDTLRFKQEDDDRLQLSDLPTIAAKQAELIGTMELLGQEVRSLQ